MSNRHRKQRKGRRVDAKGRSIGEGNYVKLANYLLDSQAYLSLTPAARAVYIQLRRRFNGSNNGYIGFSVRDAAAEVKIAKDTATRAFKELQEKGFIRCREKGSFNFKKLHASEWILTQEKYNGQLPTKDFMRWEPKEKAGPKSGTVQS